ncbi:MAG: hypothetical protein A2010_07305 [Nitrospirae bacterium GWD2_57_9]|nr:MAG: hypothetical protein A2010_07305 [Nitrospirae bacterium GWD2_57_9]
MSDRGKVRIRAKRAPGAAAAGGREGGMEKRICTDIWIPQSELWKNTTRYAGGPPSGAVPAPALYRRLRPYLRLILILANFHRCDCVVNADIRTAQLLGLIRTVFRLKYPRHIVLELMLDEEEDSLFWRLKKMLQRLCFSSVDLIHVSSRHEADSYAARLNKSAHQVRFIPFHTNIAEPRPFPRGDYVFSAGKTGRDYGVLAEAVRNLAKEVIVVSDRRSVSGISFPPNVKLFTDIPYRQYLELLSRCQFVVVPLKKACSSSGQVVFLEAMACGKPVIATKTTGTRDYIEPGVNGLLVPANDAPSLRSAIETLDRDHALAGRIAEHALERVRSEHTFERYVSTVLDSVREVGRYREGKRVPGRPVNY